MISPRLHLEIDAVWDGSEWRIVSPEGVACQVLKAATIRSLRPNTSIVRSRPDRVMLADPAWNNRCTRMAKSLSKALAGTHSSTDAWGARCNGWCVSLRNGKKCAALRGQRMQRLSHDSWGERLKWMNKRCSENTRHARRMSDGWTNWCENSTNNGAKRARRKAM